MTVINNKWQWGSSPKIYFKFEYEKQRSGASMQYRFRITLLASNNDGGAYFGYPVKISVSLDGVKKLDAYQMKASSPNKWSDISYTTSWYTVSNKTTGTTACIFSPSSSSGRTGSYSVALPIDPALSTLTASNGTLNSAQTITITKQQSSYTTTITYSCGNASGTIATKTSDTSVSWTPPTSLASQNVNGASVTVTLTAKTYSGNTLLGSTTKIITESMPSSVKPTISVTLSDDESLQPTYGYVQGKSKLKVAIAITNSYSATTKSIAVTVGSVTATANNSVFELPTDGSIPVSVKVTDSRQRYATYSGSVTVVAYSDPSVSFSVKRCNSDGTDNETGLYARIDWEGTITALTGNTATYKLQSRESGAESWTESTISSTPVILSANETKAYDFRISAEDDIAETQTQIQSIPTAFVLMQGDVTGTGISFGTPATVDHAMVIALQIEAPNVMPDYVVSQGTEDGWIYRKWKSGICEAFGSFSGSVAVTITSPGYGGYRSDSMSLSIPSGMFDTVTHAFGTKNTATAIELRNALATTSAVTFYFGSGASETQNLTVSFHVIGTWSN